MEPGISAGTYCANDSNAKNGEFRGTILCVKIYGTACDGVRVESEHST